MARGGEGLGFLTKVLATFVMALSLGFGSWLVWKMIRTRPAALEWHARQDSGL